MDQISLLNLELRLQIYSMLKIVDATIMCMLFHEHYGMSGVAILYVEIYVVNIEIFMG